MDILSSFVRKLYAILSNPKWKNVIAWTKNGKSFRVLNEPLMISEILTTQFRHSSILTFSRHLEMYGFTKEESPAGEKTFSHPYFLRDSKEDLWRIRKQGSTDLTENLRQNSGQRPKISNSEAGSNIPIDSEEVEEEEKTMETDPKTLISTLTKNMKVMSQAVQDIQRSLNGVSEKLVEQEGEQAYIRKLVECHDSVKQRLQEHERYLRFREKAGPQKDELGHDSDNNLTKRPLSPESFARKNNQRPTKQKSLIVDVPKDSEV